MWNTCDNISFGNTVYVSFYGGEPLVNVHLIEQVISYLNENNVNRMNFVYSMTTNAYLLNIHSEFLIKNNFHLLISLDGDEYNHSYRITKKGDNSFNKVFENICRLRNENLEYFKKYVNFNAVLHDRNSFEEVVDFIKSNFGKIPRLSELTTAGLDKNRVNDFNKIFKNRSNNTNHKSNLEDNVNIKELLSDTNISIFNLFIDSSLNNTYNSINELFENHESDKKYFPTGTCLPFQRKLFLTVNGNIFPCEKIGQRNPLGKITENGVDIDFEHISSIYNKMYSSVINNCNKCLKWKNCGQCIFLLQNDDNEIFCNTVCNLMKYKKYLSDNLSLAEENTYIYEKIISEIID